ncbi:uncharacterized protein [Pleurodeles waltl]|uniref:uncharacterized protein isoform X2 n=1 Tax=Pleurodeles waltl TaxID=8319 RepID=UPI003709884F
MATITEAAEVEGIITAVTEEVEDIMTTVAGEEVEAVEGFSAFFLGLDGALGSVGLPAHAEDVNNASSQNGVGVEQDAKEAEVTIINFSNDSAMIPANTWTFADPAPIDVIHKYVPGHAAYTPEA